MKKLWILLCLLCLFFGMVFIVGSFRGEMQRQARLQAELRLIAKFHHQRYSDDWESYIQKLEKFGGENSIILEGTYLKECKKYGGHSPNTLSSINNPNNEEKAKP